MLSLGTGRSGDGYGRGGSGGQRQHQGLILRLLTLDGGKGGG